MLSAGGGVALVWLAGCDGGSLGRVASPGDAATDVPADAEPTFTCSGPGGAPGGLRDTTATAPPSLSWGDVRFYVAGPSAWLVPGRAVVVGDAIHWASGDNTCGRMGNAHWWGVRMTQLRWEPDLSLHTSWECYGETWRAYAVTTFEAQGQVGVLYNSHVAPPDTWSFAAGRVDAEGFRQTVRHTEYATAVVGVVGGRAHLLYVAPGQRRMYQALDAGFEPDGDPVQLAGDAPDMGAHPVGLIAWGDRLAGFWNEPREGRQDVRVEVFSPDGSVAESWFVRERTMRIGASVALSSPVEIESGFAAIVHSSSPLPTGRTFLGRFCHDGRWRLDRIADGTRAGRLMRWGRNRWVVALNAEVGGGSQRLGLFATDDAVRRTTVVQIVDEARNIELGDLVLVPRTQDPAVLFARSMGPNASWELRVLRTAPGTAR